MKFLKYLIFLILIFIIGFSIYIAVQPNDFEITKSKTINAPASVISEIIKDSTQWNDWMPWKDTYKLTTIPSTNALGIHQHLTESSLPNTDINWLLQPNGDGTTTINRTLKAGNLSFGVKMAAFFKGGYENYYELDTDDSFNKLSELIIKSIDAYTITVNGLTDYGGGFYMYKTASSTASNISNTIAKQYADILNYMNSNSIPMSGMPFTIYLQMDFDNGDVIMSNAIPVNSQVVVTDESNILCGYIDRTTALKVTLKGNYTNLKETWSTAYRYLNDNQIVPSEMSPFEIYINDPGDIPNPANWITEIYIPISTEETEVSTP